MERHYRSTIVAIALFSLALLHPCVSQAQGNNPQIIPPHAQFHGLTYGQLEAKWWQALFAIPVAGSPFFSGGAFGDEQGLLFLTGVGGPPPVTVDITIPAGTALFFPLINAECSSLEPPPFFGATEDDQRECANAFMDHVIGLFAEIDGRTVQNIGGSRSQSPQFTFTVPLDNILGVSGPATGTSVDAGFYLLLAPLSVGKHTLHFGASLSGSPADFSIDTTYDITVVR